MLWQPGFLSTSSILSPAPCSPLEGCQCQEGLLVEATHKWKNTHMYMLTHACIIRPSSVTPEGRTGSWHYGENSTTVGDPDPKWDAVVLHFTSYNRRQTGLHVAKARKEQEIQNVLWWGFTVQDAGVTAGFLGQTHFSLFYFIFLLVDFRETTGNEGKRETGNNMQQRFPARPKSQTLRFMGGNIFLKATWSYLKLIKIMF